MRHLGDITKISGHTAPIVDCIVGGSPCQGLSQAGLREGLDDERSGLFIEQIRIAKEMRSEDERNGRTGVDIRPRYMVWENVPGAFSSNKGEDFRTVLEEIAKVTDKDAVIPLPDQGKWTTCGCIVADGWSIAWRVLDAQFWGVPQRRRRIALVADFGGQSAPEILLIRKSLSGHTDEGKPKGKKPTTDASRGIRADDCYCYDIGEARLRTPSEYKDLSPTLSARCGTGGNNTPAVITFEPGIASREGGHVYEGVCGTLRANAGDNQMVTVYSKSKRAQSDKDYESWQESDTANTLNAFDTGDVRTTEAVVYAVHTRYIVRRLTPLECERLQGYPDGWTDIGEYIDSTGKKRKPSDAARYKALGNSIALPPWKWVLKRICACYERDATMASLFDGIGGFPYLWEQLNGKGSCLWASEIEEFPMAVTKMRIGE